MNQKELENAAKDLKRPDLQVKLKAIESLICAAKTNVDIGIALEALSEILSEDNQDLWQAAADALIYYYVNYISFYCQNFEVFPKPLRELKSPDREIRKSGAFWLSYHSLFKPEIGRNWKFMEDNEIQQHIDDLKSSDLELKLKSARTLLMAVKDSFEIYQAVPFLQEALHNEDRKLRWLAAEVLGVYISKYLRRYRKKPIDSYFIEKLKSKSAENRRIVAKGIGGSAQGAWGTDKDERDTSEYIPALIVCLYEDDSILRENALNSLKDVQYEHDISYALPAISRLLSDNNQKNMHETASKMLAHNKKQ